MSSQSLPALGCALSDNTIRLLNIVLPRRGHKCLLLAHLNCQTDNLALRDKESGLYQLALLVRIVHIVADRRWHVILLAFLLVLTLGRVKPGCR